MRTWHKITWQEIWFISRYERNEKHKIKRTLCDVCSGGRITNVGIFVFEISFHRQHIMAVQQARFLYYYHVLLVVQSPYHDGIWAEDLSLLATVPWVARHSPVTCVWHCHTQEFQWTTSKVLCHSCTIRLRPLCPVFTHQATFCLYQTQNLIYL